MKKFFIRALCFILLIATLMPMVAACNDNPPPIDDPGNGGGGDEASDAITLKVVSQNSYKLADFDDDTYVNNNGLSNKLVAKDGKTTLKLTTGSSISTTLTEVKDLTYATLRFYIYAEKATGSVNISIGNVPRYGGTWRIEQSIPINFTGWKEIVYEQHTLSGYGSADKTAQTFSVSLSGDNTVYLASVDVTTDVYGVDVSEGIDVNDPALYDSIIKRAKDIFVGNESVEFTEEYTEQLAVVNESCATVFAEYNATKSTPTNLLNCVVTFPSSGPSKVDDVNWAKDSAQGPISTFYSKISAMALAYAMKGSDYYKDADVLAAIKFCLDYGYENYFGQSFLEMGAYANWWTWEIGIPSYLHPTLVFIHDELTIEECEKYLEAFDYYVPYPQGTGGNKIDLTRYTILSAALRHDAVDLCIAIEYMDDIFGYIDDYTQEGGFFKDYSFIQHFNTAYTHGYGGIYMNDLPKTLYFLHETPFFPQNDNVNNLYLYVLEAYRPTMYKNRVMNAMAGRGVSSGRDENARNYAASWVLMHYLAPDEYKAKLEPLIAYYMGIYNTSFAGTGTLCMVNYANDLYIQLRDLSVEDYEITRVYGMMARVVHHGSVFGACLSISNTNIIKFESFDGTNRVGWYQNDGMLQVYSMDYTFDSKFYQYANPYLMPGVTCNSAERNPMTHAPVNWSDYAGGINQGKYGSAGYINEYGNNADSFVSGNATNTYAKKSYFFFDNEIVCIGTGISDSSGTDVKTVVDNRYWRDSDTFSKITASSITAVGTPATVNTQITERAVHFTYMGGYVMLDSNNLYYRKATNTYNGTRSDTTSDGTTHDFLELYISHGTNAATTSKYAYAYLPGADTAATQEYLNNPDVVVLKDSTSIHAVLEKDLGIVAANFFDHEKELTVSNSATAVKYIYAETLACVMITKGEDGQYTISVSDPTNSLDSLSLEIQITGITKVVSMDDKVSASVSGGVVTIDIAAQKSSLRGTFNLVVA